MVRLSGVTLSAVERVATLALDADPTAEVSAADRWAVQTMTRSHRRRLDEFGVLGPHAGRQASSSRDTFAAEHEVCECGSETLVVGEVDQFPNVDAGGLGSGRDCRVPARTLGRQVDLATRLH